MNLTVLAASGRTGLAVTRQALERRETVAAAMLDEAEAPRFTGTVALPLAG